MRGRLFPDHVLTAVICADELAMADEAFALSPIAARPVQPSEADYDAIKEAFMETSRGRWFLGEYAKRNRNTDTTMVLDAVARIEETLAAQQQKPVRDPLLDEALTSFRVALSEARAAATVALGDLALEQNLAPVRKGARVIREIAWRLREIGADGRICDLIDSQVAAIEGATTRLAPADLAVALNGAFDRIEGKIAAFDDDAATSGSPPEASPQDPAAAAQAEVPTAVRAEDPTKPGKTMQASSVAPEAETAAAGRAVANEPPAAEQAVADEPTDAFDANDEAMLDMVALAMAAPDTDTAYEPNIEEAEDHETQVNEAQVNGHQIDTPQAGKIQARTAAYEIDVTFESETGSAAEKAAVAMASPAATPLQPAPESEAEPEPAPSLGSSLLANGIVSRPRVSRPDPLAPIRRMSQNEKIAFFS
jgi:hypothetical protein